MKKGLSEHEKEELRKIVKEDMDRSESGVEYVDLQSKRAFTKLYIEVAVKFKVSKHDCYWLTMIQHLTFNENSIWMIDSETKRMRTVHSHNDMMSLIGISRGTYFKFYKECQENGYIAKFETKKDKGTKFVVNPMYALNGNKMPLYLYNLFNKTDEEYDNFSP